VPASDDAAVEAVGSTRPLLRISNVHKEYPTGGAPVRALRGVDLALEHGDFVAVAGPSGCGKSTLLNLIAGLDRVTEGEIVLCDEPVTGRSEDDLARLRRRLVGVVFQFFELLDSMSVLDNVAFPMLVGKASRRVAEPRARDLLDLVGLPHRAQAMPSSLAGDERQRVAIARALANAPALVLADEPTGALDSEGSAEIGALLRRINDGGQTILLVTHDAEVAAFARRTERIKNGRIVSPA